MAEPVLQFTLIEREEFSQPGPFNPDGVSSNYPPYITPDSENPERDKEILAALDAAARTHQLQKLARDESKNETHWNRSGRLYYGGSVTVIETIHYLSYAGIAVAGFATFVHHVLASIHDWKKLREGRTFRIDVNGTPVEFKDNVSALEVLAKIQETINKPLS